MDPKTHPVITVTNIRNFISFTLKMESGQYTSWAELFCIHCRAFQVGNHIDPNSKPPSSTASTATEPDKTKAATELESWSRLDAICLQWIYSTISKDLLHTILKMLADQLANVGNPVSNTCLVLQLIVGLNESYEGVAMLIQQTTRLLDFYDVRSKLIMEEARKAR
ncbi:uncharacterized protein LOC111905438 [Lactuca sativa]|uniref:uncharacterized protein LOC111905438 n=1 Tax=Lactuca sativa TaxID=4236 RepID=UPI000CD8C14C|nr:uncharacterized protein LOC111905438 [Lactuca sativa]